MQFMSQIPVLNHSSYCTTASFRARIPRWYESRCPELCARSSVGLGSVNVAPRRGLRALTGFGRFQESSDLAIQVTSTITGRGAAEMAAIVAPSAHRPVKARRLQRLLLCLAPGLVDNDRLGGLAATLRTVRVDAPHAGRP